MTTRLRSQKLADGDETTKNNKWLTSNTAVLAVGPYGDSPIKKFLKTVLQRTLASP